MTPQEMTAKEKQELSAGQEKTRPGRHYMPDVDIANSTTTCSSGPTCRA